MSGLLAFMLAPQSLLAQVPAEGMGSIEGIVTETRSGRSLGTVQVTIPQLRRGALTNPQGRFTISGVPAGSYTAEFSVLGFKSENRTVTVAAGQPVVVNVELAENVLSLDELVVTGTTTNVRQREVGTAVSQIDAKDIAMVRGASGLGQALQGQVPGLMMSQSGPQPGSAPVISLRGRKSISQGDEPLFFVDGVRMYARATGATGSGSGGMPFNPIAHIKPEDIERVEVVRGAAATTLYGTEASNGVIQIFTRRGSSDLPTRWDASVTAGANTLQWPGPDDKSINPDGLGYFNCVDRVDVKGVVYGDITCPKDGDWVKPGLIQRYHLGVSGGLGTFTYALSGHLGDEDAPIDGSGNDYYAGVDHVGYSRDGGVRANFGMSFTPSIHADWISSLSMNTARWVPVGSASESVWSAPMQRGTGGSIRLPAGDPNAGALATGLHFSELDAMDYRRQIMTGFNLSQVVNSSFDHKVAFGYDLSDVNGEHWYHYGHISYLTGRYQVSSWEARTTTFDYSANYRARLMGGELSSTTSAGFQANRESIQSWGQTGTEYSVFFEVPLLSNASIRTVNNDRKSAVVNAGGYLQQVLGYKDYLFVTAGLRLDGNSASGSGMGVQAYPKLSVSYVLSDMDFWPSETFELFRLRGAVGEAGKAPGAFDAVKSWASIVSGDGIGGFTTGALGNPDLGPERSREFELGFDGSLYGGRVTTEVTGFLQRTFDALVPMQYPPSQGFLSPQPTNVGTLQNKGMEANLGLGLLRLKNYSWDTDLMMTLLRSEAIDLDGEEIAYGFSEFSGSRGWVREGYPIPAIFGTRITNPDAIADPILETDSYYGPAIPTHTFGFRTSLTIHNNLTVSAFGEYQGGSYIQNQTGQRMVLNGTFTPCFDALHAEAQMYAGDPTAYNQLSAIDRAKCSANANNQSPDRWYEKNDFFRLRSVNLDYTLPVHLIPGAQSASLGLSASNLLTITDYWGNDPESRSSADLPSIDYHAMPGYKTYTASLNVTF
ncbi:MAG: TonB-dependent receptor [Gemmatimonadota bacterium]|nr:TonB-dependent receptor [Gemmatimonadota bacterium]